MCQAQKIKRWELVELTIPALSTGRINFNTIPQLRNQANQMIIIKSISVFDVNTYSKSQTNNSIPGMPTGEWQKAVLVLYVNGEESVKMIPLPVLANVLTVGGSTPQQSFPVTFDDLTNVDFDKSYVQLNQASDANIYVIPFGITYLRMQKDPNGNMIES